MGPRFTRRAALFYGALIFAALFWNSLSGRKLLLLGNSLLASLALGTLIAVGTVSLGLLIYRIIPVMRRLADELAPTLVDGAARADLVLISLLSGVGEEVFFRGAVQPQFGLITASTVFGLVHIGPDRRYLVWTAWAIFAGFLFGFLYEFTGGVLASAVAHSLHNAATFLIWKRSRPPAVETKLS